MAIKVWKRMPNIPWFETLSSVFGQFLSNFFVPRGLVKMITWSDPTNITLVPFFHSCVESPSPSTWIARSLIISKLFVLLTMSDCHRFVHIWYSSNHHRLVVYNFSLYQIVLNLFIWLPIYYQIIRSSCCQITLKKDCELIILSDYLFIKTWFAKFGLVW